MKINTTSTKYNCSSISSLLAFELFAYYFLPSQWYYPACAVFCHALCMAILHGFVMRSTWTSGESAAAIVYNCVVNGFANVFVHNRVDIFRRGIKKHCEKDKYLTPGFWCMCDNLRVETLADANARQSTFWRQAFFDLIFMAEVLGMVAMGR